MGKRIRKCRECGRYTLSEKCPECGSGTGNPRPAAYVPSDPYAAYRRQYKAAMKESKNSRGVHGYGRYVCQRSER